MGVKVHLLKRYAGPLGNFPSGRTIEVPEGEVAGLVAAGACELIAGMRPYVSPESVVRSLEEAKAKADAEAAEKAKPKRETATEKSAEKREKADEK